MGPVSAILVLDPSSNTVISEGAAAPLADQRPERERAGAKAGPLTSTTG